MLSTTLCEQHLLVEIVWGSLPTALGLETQVSLLRPPVGLLFAPSAKFAGTNHSNFPSDLIGRHELLVLIDDWTTETALLNDNGGEDEAWTDFNEGEVCVGGPALLARRRIGNLLYTRGTLFWNGILLASFCLVDLVTSNPDLSASNGEGHDMVDKRLGLARTLWDTKSLGEQLLDEFEVGLGFERGVEGQDGSGALQTVACEVELFHGV